MVLFWLFSWREKVSPDSAIKLSSEIVLQEPRGKHRLVHGFFLRKEGSKIVKFKPGPLFHLPPQKRGICNVNTPRH